MLDKPRKHDNQRLWEYAVLVTDAPYRLGAIGQLYRDRADAENGFDELKNQWGLSGLTTADMNRCQSTARVCALVYNWWSWYCRRAHPDVRLEAITSRPLLLAAVGKAANHAGQTTLYLTRLHGKTDTLKKLIANVGAAAACSGNCGAVQEPQLRGNAVALRQRPRRPDQRPTACRLWATGNGVNAGFRVTGPYQPQTNGKAERFIQTCLREWAYGCAWARSNKRTAWLSAFLAYYYKIRRLHSGLRYQPPASRIAGNNLLKHHT